MGRAADGDAGGGRHRAPGGLPRRPAAGVGLVRAELEHRAAHRAREPEGPGWGVGLAVLRRVRDSLASGRQL